MILEPSAADTVKRAIDAVYPVWRQVGISCIPSETTETPEIAIIEIGGVRHAVAAGSSNAVFGAGHLAIPSTCGPRTAAGAR